MRAKDALRMLHKSVNSADSMQLVISVRGLSPEDCPYDDGDIVPLGMHMAKWEVSYVEHTAVPFVALRIPSQEN